MHLRSKGPDQDRSSATRILVMGASGLAALALGGCSGTEIGHAEPATVTVTAAPVPAQESITAAPAVTQESTFYDFTLGQGNVHVKVPHDGSNSITADVNFSSKTNQNGVLNVSCTSTGDTVGTLDMSAGELTGTTKVANGPCGPDGTLNITNVASAKDSVTAGLLAVESSVVNGAINHPLNILGIQIGG